MTNKTFEVSPVGYLRRDGEKTFLEISESCIPALKQLEHFSHVQVFWWFSEFQGDEHRATTQTQPPYDEAPISGVFALRAPMRPNPIGLTTAEVLNVDHKRGIVEITNIDAFDGTPILDLKAHMPVEDRVKDARIPEWMADWPEWVPEERHRLEENRSIPIGGEANSFEILPVGYVRRGDGGVLLHIQEPYIPALKNLEHFSHARVLWWFHRLDGDRFRRATHNKPPYENAPVTGVFASRSPVRPNPIGLTTARIVSVDHEHGIVELAGVDAFNETPILDLKPYIPSNDRVKQFRVPEWIAHWSAWHQGFEETETVDAENLRPADSDRLAAFQAAQPVLPTPSERPSHEHGGLKEEYADAILIRGARQHNLKNVDVTIPQDKFTVITGVSGSGKSSLAFDTLYAEGRRRYVGSLSTLARRLVGQMEKPQVDHILGLVPTIAIEQGSVSRNPRSTVGTVTEVQDYLRVLFARVGTRHCPQCGRGIKPQTARRIADQLSALVPGTRFQLLAPIVRAREGTHKDVLEQARRNNHKVRIDGEILDPSTTSVSLAETEPHTIEWIVENLIVPENGQTEFHNRIFDAAETGLQAGGGYLTVVLEGEEEVLLSQHTVCPHCNIFFFELSPALFSFNNPDGMCSDCNGLGVKLSVDPELIVTDPDLSLLDGASPWYGELRKVKPSGNWMRSELFALADVMHVDLELPWRELPQAFRDAALYGTGDEIISWTYDMKKRGRSISFERPAQGAVNNIKRLLQRTDSERAREGLMGFMRKRPCPTCGGERLCADARFITVGGTRFPEVASMTLARVHQWITSLSHRLTPEQRQIAHEVVVELDHRLASLLNVGLHYLALDRPAPTLSGGEGQRIRLATQLGCGLTGLLYVLDEPSIGLHPRDHKALLNTLTQLRDEGNTVVVVEHDTDTMRAADWLIDLGPGAGTLGGEIIAAGTPEEVMADPASLTGQYLSGNLHVASPNGKERREPQSWLTLTGARLHNLKEVDARFPLGLMTCVTGVSGSGKSSLVAQTLSPALARALHGAESTPGPHSSIEGLNQVNKVINIDQVPIGRTPRSNPGTYVGAFDEIRKVFASTPEAKDRKFKANRFSFNAKVGQCGACQGHGRKRIEMHFLPDVWVTCSDCEGKRFNRQTLEIEYREKSIADVLDMDIEEARTFFADHDKITRILQTLHDVGLGYLKLGQSALTLSGGEAQRVKLAKELCRPDTGRTVYILDEPTTGLHFADIQKLLDVLHRLTDAGNTVIIIEHNLDVIKTADWIIDIGPEGGDAGGHIVAQGTPEQVAQVTKSYTGQFLQSVL
ncbi:MAG: excinuclease ABC subunit UvrA [Chloroflexi bacterium]|nr:excinuclease ABC subunit UvrA [Chloroflexota bacterium]